MLGFFSSNNHGELKDFLGLKFSKFDIRMDSGTAISISLTKHLKFLKYKIF